MRPTWILLGLVGSILKIKIKKGLKSNAKNSLGTKCNDSKVDETNFDM